MSISDAETLVALLIAAYPHDALEEESVSVYSAALQELTSAQYARQAIQTIVRNENRLPSIAMLRLAYHDAKKEAERAEAYARQQAALEPPHGPRTLPPEVKEYLLRLRGEEVKERG